jgi:hypothetical protein
MRLTTSSSLDSVEVQMPSRIDKLQDAAYPGWSPTPGSRRSLGLYYGSQADVHCRSPGVQSFSSHRPELTSMQSTNPGEFVLTNVQGVNGTNGTPFEPEVN